MKPYEIVYFLKYLFYCKRFALPAEAQMEPRVWRLEGFETSRTLAQGKDTVNLCRFLINITLVALPCRAVGKGLRTVVLSHSEAIFGPLLHLPEKLPWRRFPAGRQARPSERPFWATPVEVASAV